MGNGIRLAAVREAAPPEPAPAAAAVPTAVPVVQTILFSPGRSVALIDGRIVKPGDRIGEGRVAEIRRDAVVVETPDGRADFPRPAAAARMARDAGDRRAADRAVDAMRHDDAWPGFRSGGAGNRHAG